MPLYRSRQASGRGKAGLGAKRTLLDTIDIYPRKVNVKLLSGRHLPTMGPARGIAKQTASYFFWIDRSRCSKASMAPGARLAIQVS
jgi:hypothetical protein